MLFYAACAADGWRKGFHTAPVEKLAMLEKAALCWLEDEDALARVLLYSPDVGATFDFRAHSALDRE